MTAKKIVRVLKKIEIILLILSSLCTLFVIVAGGILPAHGINIMASTRGDSMYPTIQEGALFVWYDRDRVPFEDVKAGDIIIFREQDRNYSDDVPTPDYTKYHAIMHRAVEIIEDTDRAIITAGDGNGYTDQWPVLNRDYIGKVVYHRNNIGWPLRILTVNFGFFWLIGVTALLGILVFVLSHISNRKETA